MKQLAIILNGGKFLTGACVSMTFIISCLTETPIIRENFNASEKTRTNNSLVKNLGSNSSLFYKAASGKVDTFRENFIAGSPKTIKKPSSFEKLKALVNNGEKLSLELLRTVDINMVDPKTGNTLLHMAAKNNPETAQQLLDYHNKKQINIQKSLTIADKELNMPWEIAKDRGLALMLFRQGTYLAEKQDLAWLLDENTSIKNAYNVINEIRNNSKIDKISKANIIKKLLQRLPKDHQLIYEQITKLKKSANEIWSNENDVHLKELLFNILTASPSSINQYERKKQLADFTLQEAVIRYPLTNDTTILDLLEKRGVSFKDLVNEENVYTTVAECGSLSILLWLLKNGEKELPEKLSPYAVIICMEKNPQLKELQVRNSLDQVLKYTGTFCQTLKLRLKDILQHKSETLSDERRKEWSEYLSYLKERNWKKYRVNNKSDFKSKYQEEVSKREVSEEEVSKRERSVLRRIKTRQGG